MNLDPDESSVYLHNWFAEERILSVISVYFRVWKSAHWLQYIGIKLAVLELPKTDSSNGQETVIRVDISEVN